MALSLAGGPEGVQEVVEALYYAPGVQDSGDLEAATKTVTATARPGTADYTANLTIPAPSDGRLRLLRAAVRLGITIDSFNGGATRLNYAVEVNGVERLTGYWTATGGQYAAADLTTGQFNVGSANQLKVYLWVDQGNAVVSLCQLWQGVGSCLTSYGFPSLLQVTHKGLMSTACRLSRVGAGNPTIRAMSGQNPEIMLATATGVNAVMGLPSLVTHDLHLGLIGTVATDLNYIDKMAFTLRRFV